MANLNAARQAKADKHLAGLIRTTQYGITTRKERLDRAMADGGRLEVVQVFDEAREKAILREMESMRRGKGVPSGNECHPLTIKFNALKQELADRPMRDQYELHPKHTNGDTWFNVLTKTEYEYALTLESPAVRCDQCAACMIQGVFCHETGCPNTSSRYDTEDGIWVKQYKCRECGSMVDEDESCCDEQDDDFEMLEREDTDSLEDRGLTLGSYGS